MSSRWRGVAAAGLLTAVLACKQEPAPAAQAAAEPPPPARGTTEWKIQNAMSAAPREVSAGATIMEWATSPDSAPRQVRAGTNGWTCFTDSPESPGNDPMCFDSQFGNWATAWMSHRAPAVTGLGVAYMLEGGSDASNTDPFKMRPDSGQPWVDTGPHIMVVVPNVAGLRGLSTDPSSGGPFIMWQGTPYAHVMVPVQSRRRPSS